jgi:hypothetical protein
MAAWLTPDSQICCSLAQAGTQTGFGDFPLEIIQKTLLFRCQLGLHNVSNKRFQVSVFRCQKLVGFRCQN